MGYDAVRKITLVPMATNNHGDTDQKGGGQPLRLRPVDLVFSKLSFTNTAAKHAWTKAGRCLTPVQISKLGQPRVQQQLVTYVYDHCASASVHRKWLDQEHWRGSSRQVIGSRQDSSIGTVGKAGIRVHQRYEAHLHPYSSGRVLLTQRTSSDWAPHRWF